MPTTISGRVIARIERGPLSGITVDIVDPSGEVVGNVQTDARGWFSYSSSREVSLYAVPRLERAEWECQIDARAAAQAVVRGPDGHPNTEAGHTWHTSHVTDHTGLGSIGTTTHAAVDSHIADSGIHGGGGAPAGAVSLFAGATAPSGWLLCDGAAVSQATYAALYTVIGLTYGDPGGGNFNLPDLRGRFPLGVDGTHALGVAGGNIDHTHTGPAAHSEHVFTQPAGHSAHVFTQAGAHSDHGVTQPSAHSAHVFTQPSGHSAHAVTQPNNHVDVLNHVHRENRQGSQAGTLDGWATGDTGTSTPLLTGYSTADPTTGGVAAQVHAGTAVDAHSAHAGGAVDAHSAHSGVAVDAHSAHSGAGVDAHSVHSGGAVDAHSAHGATGTGNPPFVSLNFIIKT